MLGREDLTDTEGLELGGVGLGDDAADDDRHVTGAFGLQPVEDLGYELHVGAGQDRDADRVDVLVDRSSDDLLGCESNALVDDLETGVAGTDGHLLRADLLGAGPGDAEVAARGPHDPRRVAEEAARAERPAPRPRAS